MGEWVADAPPRVLAALGTRRDPLAGEFPPPDEATIRRLLERVDAAALDAAVGSWFAARLHPGGQPPPPGRPVRRPVAVAGKAVRGTRHASPDGQAVHLPAAAGQQAGTVLAQARVDGKTSEITASAPLPEPLDLAGCVITADALHPQREHAEFPVSRKAADYLLIVKKNQPTLHDQLASLPRRQVPVAHNAREQGHGRTEWRTLKIATVAAGLAFPHAARALQIRRRRRPLKGGTRWPAETIYAITSLATTQATPAELATWARGHWGIEAPHHIRDATYGQDASQVRTGSGPQAMATLRNLAIGTLKLSGASNIAGATRHLARDATRPLTALGPIPP